ncbi:MAG TPA: ankyrin repeat domain-containing protein, partial [Coxiellaceae bacterium]|nr:ankyrin repeat domain-containing protein [Coxiellaceae bacterium]
SLHPLHKAALLGEISEVEKLLAKGADANGLADVKKSPLQFVSNHFRFRLGTYGSIILLLEAGADPLQMHTCDPYYAETSPLFEVIRAGHLALVRLYLWYIKSDYEDIPVKNTLIVPSSTLEGYIQFRDKEEKIVRQFARWVKETGIDAKKARELNLEAAAALEHADFATAGKAYFQIAQLYAKHEKLEKELIYYHNGRSPEYNAIPELYRPIFIAHYHSKRVYFLKLANEQFNQLKERYPDSESIAAHAGALSDLADCETVKRFDHSDSAFRILLDRAYKVSMMEAVPVATSSKRDSDVSTIMDSTVETDDKAEADTTPLLASPSSEIRSHSIFSSKLRQRKVTTEKSLSISTAGFTFSK